MKRFLMVWTMGMTLSLGIWAQESEAAKAATMHEAAAAEEHEEGDKYAVWKWANFAILAVVLGYMLNKALPPFFAGRTADIQKGIAEAAAMKADAEKRAAEMERRMTALSVEIEQIRTGAKDEMQKEANRIAKETEYQLARLQAQGEHEIASLTKHAMQQLKAHSAMLALELAEQRIRGGMTDAAQSGLVARFVSSLDRQGARL